MEGSWWPDDTNGATPTHGLLIKANEESTRVCMGLPTSLLIHSFTRSQTKIDPIQPAAWTTRSATAPIPAADDDDKDDDKDGDGPVDEYLQYFQREVDQQ
jgi:hypothetical protein